MKKYLLGASFLMVLFLSNAQSITGRVIQQDEYATPLYGATVQVEGTTTGTTSGLAGFFTMANMAPGTYRLRVSFVGFKAQTIELAVPQENPLVVALEADVALLDAVTVEGRAYESIQLLQAPASTIRVSDLPLIHVPRLMGEPDLIRMVQNLPGVKTETDFTGGFSVRGGRNDQNLILLDGVPVYNPWHLFGLFSAFNTEAIARVDLTKGIQPPQFGSRLSSVLDIELQKGDTRLGAGYLTVSPLSSSFSYGRPINQKTSLLVSIRRTYMDPIFWIVNAASSGVKQEETSPGSSLPVRNDIRLGYAFSDINFKVAHKFNAHHSLEFAFFRSRDELKISDKRTRLETPNWLGAPRITENKLGFGWRNATGLVAFNTKKAAYSQCTQLFTSFYRSQNEFVDNALDWTFGNNSSFGIENLVVTDEYFSQLFRQQFLDVGLQHDGSFFIGDKFAIQYGGQWMAHRFEEISTNTRQEFGFLWPEGTAIPPKEQWTISRFVNRMDGDTLTSPSHELSTYGGLSYTWGKFSFFPGVRLHHYTLGNYTNLLPRFNMVYRPTNRWMVSAGYGHTSQYIQTVGIDLVRIPAERWFWANQERPPALAKMATLGLTYDLKSFGTVTVEGYFKTMEGLLNFSPVRQAEAIDDGFVPRFSQETVSGTGEAYGVEMLWQKTEGKVTGWLGYTLSWAWNQFDELNFGERFPMRTDKRHDIQTFWNWQFATNWSFGMLFNYKTGQPVTFSPGRYLVDIDPLGIDDWGGQSVIINKMNNFRLPDYHRLDLNLTWQNRKFLKRKTEWSLNVVNVYNRFNVLTVVNQADYRTLPNGRLRVIPGSKYYGQLPIVPVVSARIAMGGDAK